MSLLRRLLLSILAISCTVFLGGCPHHIENMVEEMLPPEGYKPIYMTSTVPFTALAEEYREKMGISVGAPMPAGAVGDSLLAEAGLKLTMEIRTVDDSRYPDEVELRAFVYDTAGRFVKGLAPPHFAGEGTYRDYWRTLTDSCGGEAHEIGEFEVTEVREDARVPYALGFVLDHSGSMGKYRVTKLREATGKMLRVIKRGDQVTVMAFTNNVYTEVPLSGNKRSYVNMFRPDDLANFGGGTALYDGAMAGINEVAQSPEGMNRAIILFSDGADGSSDEVIEEVQRTARGHNVAIYTIAYGLAEEEALHNLSYYTGGRMYRVYSTKEFPYVFADIYRRLNNYYRITYQPPPCAGVHTAMATLSIPELGHENMEGSGEYDRSLFTPLDPVGQTVLVNIEFDYNEATIREESMPLIREAADALERHPGMRLEIRGHTDDQGSEEYNQKLSKRRAQAVADALGDMGVSSIRLRVKGLGESQPLVENDSEENRRKNRRTEFVILSK